MSTRWIEMNILARDFEYAVRMLAKSPGFALAAILSLAIGIGANTSIFSIINALLLRPLQYQDADRLVILWNRSPGLNITEDWFSTAQYFDIKTGHHGFEQVAIAIGGNYNLTSRGNRNGWARFVSPPVSCPCSAKQRLWAGSLLLTKIHRASRLLPCLATECGFDTLAVTRE
jgi:hypothetical protein